MWILLSIAAAVALLLTFSPRRNTVWAGFGFGTIGGIITAGTYFLIGRGFHWTIIGKWMVVCTLAGLAFGLVDKLIRPGGGGIYSG